MPNDLRGPRRPRLTISRSYRLGDAGDAAHRIVQLVDQRGGVPAHQVRFAEFYAGWSTRHVWAPGTVLATRLAAGSVPFADVPL